MKKTLVAAALAATFTLTGCSSINSGTITNKTFTPAHNTTSTMCYAYIKGMCTVWIPTTTHHNDAYRFDLRKGDKTGWVSVTKDNFDKYSVGECWVSC